MTELIQRTYRAEFDVHRSQRIIEGLAVPYGKRERVSDDGKVWYFEDWVKGAFERNTLPANVGRVKLNFTHDESSPFNWIGKTLALRESAEGLLGEWRVDDTPFGDAVLFKAKDGQLPGLSVYASVLDKIPRADGRSVTRGHLRHVALVEQPAFADALVTSVRSAQPDERPRLAVWQSRLEQLRRKG